MKTLTDIMNFLLSGVSSIQPPRRPQSKNKVRPLNESRGTYNLLILHKMIQHHYESTEVIRPSQEEVENALNSITWDIRGLEEQNAELLLTLNSINNILRGSPVVNEVDMAEMIHKIQSITFIGLQSIQRGKP